MWEGSSSSYLTFSSDENGFNDGDVDAQVDGIAVDGIVDVNVDGDGVRGYGGDGLSLS